MSICSLRRFRDSPCFALYLLCPLVIIPNDHFLPFSITQDMMIEKGNPNALFANDVIMLGQKLGYIAREERWVEVTINMV